MDGHLVTVEVGVVSRANEGVNTNGLALDEHGLESLDRETVKRGGAVQENRVTLGDLFENIPNLRGLLLDHLARAANGVHEAELFEATNDERLKEDERHLLRKTALAELELGTDDDHGTAGVIHAFAEQVLTEATLLALEHVRERLQWTIAGAGDGTTMTAVIEKGVNRLLEHALLVVDDDVGRLELHQVPQTVVAVDDAAVEIVEVGGGETAPFERNKRTQVGRDNGQHLKHHPLGAGLGVDEALNDLETLRELLFDLLRLGGAHLFLKLGDGRIEVHEFETLANGFGAHLSDERIVTVFVECLAIFGVGEELFGFERGLARIDDHVVLIVDNALEGAGGHIEQEAEAAWHALEEPDVGNRDCELDVAHALAAHAGNRHLDAATIADDVFVFNALVFPARALVVADRAEDLLAEKTTWLGLESAVIDGLGVLNLAARPSTDDLGGGDGDGDAVEWVLIEAESAANFFAGAGGDFVGLDAHRVLPFD